MLSKFGPARTSVASTALEASHQLRSGAGRICALGGRLDATAPTGVYYIQVIKGNAGALPADGAVTHLLPPGKLDHTNGIDQTFNFTDMIPSEGISVDSNGAFVVLSTTEFTKTIGDPYLSIGGSVL